MGQPLDDLIRIVTIAGGGVAVGMSIERYRLYRTLKKVVPSALKPLVGHVTAVSLALSGYIIIGMVQIFQRIGEKHIVWYLPAFFVMELVAIFAVAWVTRQERMRVEQFVQAARAEQKRTDAKSKESPY
jgi:hypothetical protein